MYSSIHFFLHSFMHGVPILYPESGSDSSQSLNFSTTYSTPKAGHESSCHERRLPRGSPTSLRCPGWRTCQQRPGQYAPGRGQRPWGGADHKRFSLKSYISILKFHMNFVFHPIKCLLYVYFKNYISTHPKIDVPQRCSIYPLASCTISCTPYPPSP